MQSNGFIALFELPANMNEEQFEIICAQIRVERFPIENGIDLLNKMKEVFVKEYKLTFSGIISGGEQEISANN